ncbi:Ethanolamine ammonia-lyase reactivating factor EutA [Petrocella atlantisensis]|uniref:Ethanolamine ammonia-lyase reactivating factor EutA n=1 Tax=Petrocella atlantisensis TaxID=2173034 RepID=A0A3P7NYR7_9FIRM|nr:ethanolamine ammonia-lyase reactivating factor EutA [Petrocella atlantisensis]VDN48384.1 Ethanolamine ammonia-lyase reactivating factor EutA [Petrocella atlantisensis]
MEEKIISVGIDIGTSTTQLVFSRLTIENTASAFSIPKISIIEKEVIYKSSIYFTPLISDTEIDGEAVRKIIENDYKKAGIHPKEVDTGAVIITGETARKANASLVLENLSGLAGDFVVATAGPDLEAIIAGKGAGADIYSKSNRSVVVNLDIGGGTTNISVFKDGEIIDTTCIDLGGRLIKLHPDSMKVEYISKKVKRLADHMGILIEVGQVISADKIKKITNRMADLIEEVLGVRKVTEDLKLMLTTKDLKRNYDIDYISFSGGVADCIYGTYLEEKNLIYGDIGVFLGKSIKNLNLNNTFNIYEPTETIRATVVGAGSHTTDISGSTITFSKDIFPLKNIPILKLSVEDEQLGYEALSQVIKEKVSWFGLHNEKQQVALAIKGVKSISFGELKLLAQTIISGMAEIISMEVPLVVIVEHDIAKALGQTIQTYLAYKKDVVCIDAVNVSNGDFIDIGRPLANGRVVPIVIKTLAFGY